MAFLYEFNTTIVEKITLARLTTVVCSFLSVSIHLVSFNLMCNLYAQKLSMKSRERPLTKALEKLLGWIQGGEYQNRFGQSISA